MNELELPNDSRAEMAAVGAAIQSAAALAEVRAIVPSDGWYRVRHDTIIGAAHVVAQRGEPVEPLLVIRELESSGLLTKVGGAPYLLQLVEATPTAANAAYYAEIVAAKAVLRRVIEAGQRLVQYGFLGSEDVDEALDRARSELDAVAGSRRAGDVEPWETLLDRVVGEYGTPREDGIATPWPDIDELLGGLGVGTVTVIGARPGVGKTTLGVNIAAHAALGGVLALLQSVELPREEVLHRVVAAQAGVEYSALRNHRLDEWAWQRVAKAQEQLRSAPLVVDDRSRVGVAHIQARGRELARCGLGVVVIDYLQLIEAADRRTDRHVQLGQITRDIKIMARSLGVAVVALAQLNRASAGRAVPRPKLEDLRESGSIENDADAVLLCHLDPDRPGELQVEVAKNRHGPTGQVSLAWSPHYARARSLSYDTTRRAS